MAFLENLSPDTSDRVEGQQVEPSLFGQLLTGQTWKILNGDAVSKLKEVERESVDCCMTSPPYFWLRNYGDESQIGLEDTVESYVSAIDDVMYEVKACLKPTGVLFLNLGDTYYSGKGESQGKDQKSKKRRFGLRAVDKSGGMGIGLQRKSAIGIPWRVALKMMTNGWVLRSTIIWHRAKCLPENVSDRPRRSYEYVFMFAKSRKYFFDRDPLIKDDVDEDVWTITPSKSSPTEIDTAPFPEELVRRCLQIGCPSDGLVLDPFAGSGTTMQVALELGRSTIGIELNVAYCKYIARRLSNLI